MDKLTPITREEMLMNDEPLTPITREEKILAGEDLNPVTRREYFLKKYRHTGGEVMVEVLSVTENGTYTAPEGKAYSPVEVAVPLPENAYLLKEASGSLVSFSDGADLPMPSFICNIDAVQDLHGYDSPWVGGAGKNKYNATKITETADGITITKNEFGEYTVTGTATALHQFALGTNTIKAGDYILNGCPSGGGTSTYDIRFTNNAIDNGSGATLHLDTDTTESVSITVRNGYSFPSGGLVFKPMIRLATETDPTFTPYSNICPISGHTEVNATRCGKNLFDKTTISENKIIDSTTGEETAFYGRFSSDYIKVNPSTEYYASNVIRAAQWYCVFYYDKNKNYLSCGELPSTGDNASGVVTTPNNCNYVRLVSLTTYKDDVSFVVGNQAPIAYEPYNGQTYNIQFKDGSNPLTVYGGTLDVVSGVLTVDRASVNLGDLTYIYEDTETPKRFRASLLPTPKLSGNTICSCYLGTAKGVSALGNGELCISGTQAYPFLQIRDDAITDATAFKNSLSGQTLVYELATPQTYQLTPTQIKSLLGTNNAWCSTGDVDIDYFAKEV